MDENKQNERNTDDGFFDEPNTPNTESGTDTGDGFFDDAPYTQNPQGQNTRRDQGGVYPPYPPAPPTSPKRGRTVGKIIGGIALAVVVFFCGMLTTWLSLDGELRTLIKIKNTVQKEYYQEISDDEFYRVLFAAINDDLLDPYSQYMTYDEFSAMQGDLAGEHSGIGVAFSIADESGAPQIMVYRVVENSPAEEAGLQYGDQIVGFGKNETELTESVDFNGAFKPFLEGMETGEKFVLKVQRGDEEMPIRLSKEYYVESYVSYRTNETSYAFTGENALTYTEKGKALTCLPDDTAYIRLSQFTGNAAAGFGQVMQQFKKDGKKNLVLDLRENGGGYLEYVQYIAGYFCKNATDKNPLVTVADYGEKKVGYAAMGNVYGEYFAEDSRIVVLADSGTASASECLIGCMVDYGAVDYADICLAERGGVARTYGKGIMQTTFYLDAQKKNFLKLTTAELRWPVSGKSINGRGVLPEDGAVTLTENADGERELESAVALFFP